MSPWMSWSSCTQSCGGGQKKRYRRSVFRPYRPCRQEGTRVEYGKCNTQPCVRDSGCDLTTWSDWFPCSATCGSAEKVRTRKIAGSRVCSWDPTSEVSFIDRQTCALLPPCQLADDERFCRDHGDFSIG